MRSSLRSRFAAGGSSFEDQATELLPVIEQGPRPFTFFEDEPAEDPTSPAWGADNAWNPDANTPHYHYAPTFRRKDPDLRRTRGRGSQPRMQRWIAIGVVVAVLSVAAVGWGVSATHSDTPGASAQSTVATRTAAKSHKKKPKTKRKTSRKVASASVQSPAAAVVASAKSIAPAAAASKARATAAKATPTRTLATVSRGAVVVIDAGHQGQGDSSLEPIGPGSSTKKPKVADGASGVFAPHDESQINLDVALKLQKVLSARGVRVIMVRTSQNVNVSNSQRAAIANKAHAALFIRLHCDGISNSSKHGFSTLIPAKNQWTGPILSASAKAGRIVQRDALAATGAANAGVVHRSDLSGFNWSKVPTVLVEMGFMSNHAEDKALTTSSYQQKLAVGLANGVVDYLKTR